jgi:hypothetical protein
VRTISTFLLLHTLSVSLHTESIRTPTARFAVERAATAAIEKLEQPACQQVLTDFQDASGHTIQQALDRQGDTPRTFVSRITFHEGPDDRCQNPAILAFTTIGGRDIYICSHQFWETERKHPAHVEALLIHELLHTLGLGENPPSSLEITSRVMKRCK